MSGKRFSIRMLFNGLAARRCFNWIPDETFLKIQYYISMHKKLNLNTPATYNEKIQWLKLYDRKPEYNTMVDKLAVKDYVRQKIGDGYTFEVIGGPWNSFDEIDFNKLPNKFVLKCTHDSGGLVICDDKRKLDMHKARKKIQKSMKRNFYWANREWPYKDVKPRIFAEEYMVDGSGYELRDYKFFCFNGDPKVMFVATDRNTDAKFDFYDMSFKHLPFKNGHEWADKKINQPVCFNEMIEIAKILSEGIPQVRVDFYEIAGRVYFGEMTFSHWSGMVPFEPEEWDYIMGDMIQL